MDDTHIQELEAEPRGIVPTAEVFADMGLEMYRLGKAMSKAADRGVARLMQQRLAKQNDYIALDERRRHAIAEANRLFREGAAALEQEVAAIDKSMAEILGVFTPELPPLKLPEKQVQVKPKRRFFGLLRLRAA